MQWEGYFGGNLDTICILTLLQQSNDSGGYFVR